MAKNKSQGSRPAYWVSAEKAPTESNFYDCQKAVKEICGQLDNPRIERIHCGWNDADAAVVINALRNRNIFDTRSRIIILKGLPPNYTMLVDYLQFVNSKNYLIIDGPIGMRSQKGARFATAKTSKFYKTIKAFGGKKSHVIEVPYAAKTLNQAVKWCTEVSTSLGKPIDADAVKPLTDRVGMKYDAMYGALNRLVDYADGKQITPSDVEGVCDPEFMQTVWDLVECIDNQDCSGALIHLQKFYESASLDMDSKFIGDVEMLLGALHHHFLFCLAVADRCNGLKRFNYANVTQAVANLKRKPKADEDGAGGKWTPYFSPGYISMAMRSEGIKKVLDWRRSSIYYAYMDINSVRLLIRSGVGLWDVKGLPRLRLYLDTLIMSLCGAYSRDEMLMMRNAPESTGVV